MDGEGPGLGARSQALDCHPAFPLLCLSRQIRQGLKLSKYTQLKILQGFTGIFTIPLGKDFKEACFG